MAARPSSTTSRLGGWLLAGTVGILAAGCLPAPTPWLGESGSTVGVVGDSLVYQAEYGPSTITPPPGVHDLGDLLVVNGYRSSTSAMIGAVTADLATVSDFSDPGAEILVVGLGTNDMHTEVPVDTAIGAITAYIDRIDPRCTVLINIVEEPSWGLDVAAPPYNAALEALAASRGDVLVADWLAITQAEEGLLLPADVHHTAAGREAYRQLVLDGVRECEALVPAG